jgi:murein DD-endopeptidase MepM/ murein hydrolase activator NlpD
MPFPLPFVPKEDYHKPIGKAAHHGRYFGASRDGGRRSHAGCDLIAPVGTAIYAVDDGKVIQVSKNFYHGTGAIALEHSGGYIVRYCEVLNDSLDGIEKGRLFSAGEVVAKVGKMYSLSMLHFEMYAGTQTGPLSDKHSKSPFKRRSDLLNPTSFLDELKPFVEINHAPVFRFASFA